MIHVEKLLPSDYPSRCAFFPQRTSDPEGFIVGEELDPPPGRYVRQAVSITGLREAARRHADMVDREKLDAAQAEIVELNERIDSLEAELAEADTLQANIDGLTKHGFMVKRAPGRPKSKVEA